MSYLKIPIDLKSAVNGKLERCSYEASIAQQIMLLIVSRYGEVVGKENNGSVLWELEFSQLVKISDWENRVQESLLQAITTYEEPVSYTHLSRASTSSTDLIGSPNSSSNHANASSCCSKYSLKYSSFRCV